MAKCERCSGERVPVAEYTLQKRGSTRRVVLCKPCRDVTAQVYALEAVEAKPRRKRGSKGGRRRKKAEQPIAAVEEPSEAEGQEAEPETEGQEVEGESGAPEAAEEAPGAEEAG